VALLQAGYAYIHEFSANESNYANQLFSAERIAKASKKGVWALYDEEAEKEAVQEQEQTASATPNREYIDIIVSEVVDGSRFYVQVLNEQARKLESLMAEFADHHKKHTEPSVPKPRNGEVVSAKFTEDDSWYRAKVRKSSPAGVEVIYVDYGNVSLLFTMMALNSYLCG
jgi:staphylococcal nuclease domain-containing protein 1